MRILLLVLIVAVPLLSACAPAPEPAASGGIPSHVLLLHLDGFRGDLTRSLLESGRLPYLSALVSRGRVSFDATTLDKSETMKVIQSYLTSQLDTEVTGWWQFDRSDFRFRNYWLDPGEVASYALGLSFPRSPTIQDFLASRGDNLVASMSLARRGVPFQNYGRAYLEGIEAVGAHTYHKQARATTDAFLSIHRRIVERGEPSPRLSTLLLAAADEFSHLDGVVAETEEPLHCFDREELDDTIFARLDEDRGLEARYFTSVDRAPLTRKARSLCLELPEIVLEDGSRRRAHPSYVLSMLVLDIEIGRVVELFRSIRGESDDRRIEPPETTLLESDDPVAGSLFDETLFLVFGDHGMVDTPHGMTGDDGFIQTLNRELGLDVEGSTDLGIDYWNLPARLSDPAAHEEWQSEEVRAIVADADRRSRELVTDITELVRDGLHENYWWLFFLRSLLIDPKLDEAVAPVSSEALSVLRGLHLRGSLPYLAAEEAANRDFYDRHVRLVYGGGARNNAELFIPSCDRAACSWERRPSYDQIVSYRDGALLEALAKLPAVGLVFIRKNNEAFAHDAPLPETLEIEVRDRANRRGVIRVSRDGASGDLVFHYRTLEGAEGDPLAYEIWGAGEGTSGSYSQWNDWTVGEAYVNAVGGIGAYLYSKSPAVGDVLIMHATDWNFGDNEGGHGGLHRGEKSTFMLASGSGISPGELRGAGGHVPTLLDIVPTSLEFLGYSRETFDDFARNDFDRYLDAWIRSQRDAILSNLDATESLERAKEEAGVQGLSFETLDLKLRALLAFVEADRERMLERAEARPLLGNKLELN